MTTLAVTADAAEAQFGKLIDGEMTDDAVRALLIEIADRGETAEDLIGAARALRARMICVDAPADAIDVCGTGGDGQDSLNVSTAVAIVVAACGVPVAKHGNRAASSKAGGADTLQALGLNLDNASHRAEACLNDLGIAFLFAQKHHPALAKLAPARKSLGRRTIFNLVGPICNPARVTRQLVGVASPLLIAPYVEALDSLGCARALVVSGDEGLDELSVSGPSQVAAIGFSMATVVTPEDAGLARHSMAALRGGDAVHNAAALRRLLMSVQVSSQDRAYRDAVLLNAAGALIVAGEVRDWRDGVEEAREAIDKGLAKSLLDCWIKFCE